MEIFSDWTLTILCNTSKQAKSALDTLAERLRTPLLNIDFQPFPATNPQGVRRTGSNGSGFHVNFQVRHCNDDWEGTLCELLMLCRPVARGWRIWFGTGMTAQGRATNLAGSYSPSLSWTLRSRNRGNDM